MPHDPGDIERHLRAASDAVLLLQSSVGQLERQKRGVDPTDARFLELAAAVTEAAQALIDFTTGEEAWARAAVTSNDASLSSIGETMPEASLSAILDEWRTVERELDAAIPGSPEAIRLFEKFTRLRDTYLEAFKARQDGGVDQ